MARRARGSASGDGVHGGVLDPVFEVLDRAGFEVHLVNPRATKQVSGRKSDVLDRQWIRQLMSFGLLRGAFRAPDALCPMGSYLRQRGQLVRDRSRAVQYMQKALTQMNVQLDNVLSDIMGKTGQLIVRAIVAGERDGAVLAKFRDGRCKADAAAIAASLRGNLDLSRFASAKHFCSWRGLAPGTRISGDRRLGGPPKRQANRVGQALRMAASTARNSKTAIGAAHRRRLSRMDSAKAVKATAHQLARLIYAMLTRGEEYVERDLAAMETERRDRPDQAPTAPSATLRPGARASRTSRLKTHPLPPKNIGLRNCSMQGPHRRRLWLRSVSCEGLPPRAPRLKAPFLRGVAPSRSPAEGSGLAPLAVHGTTGPGR